MKHYFFATLTAVLEMNNDEFELLFNEAKCHYDYKVKTSTEVGGILYGFRNRRSISMEAGKPDDKVEFTERQLGLMMKALEMNHSKTAVNLYNRFLNVFKELQEKTVEVNKPLNDLKFIGHFTL